MTDLRPVVDFLRSCPDSAEKAHVCELVVGLMADLQRRQALLDECLETLQTVRVDVKYLMFDLESTRRERDLLRQELGR